MRVFILIGLTDPDSDLTPYGFCPETERVSRRVPEGEEPQFAEWLAQRGIDAALDRENWMAGGVHVDVPDHLVFEMINAWSGPR